MPHASSAPPFGAISGVSSSTVRSWQAPPRSIPFGAPLPSSHGLPATRQHRMRLTPPLAPRPLTPSICRLVAFIVSSSQSKLRRQVVTSSSTLSSTAHAGVVGGLYTSSLPDPGRLQDAKYLESQRILREAEAISHSPGHRARSAFMRLRLRTWQLHDIITRSINVRFALKISGTLTLLVVPTIVDSTATVWSYWSVLWSHIQSHARSFTGTLLTLWLTARIPSRLPPEED